MSASPVLGAASRGSGANLGGGSSPSLAELRQALVDRDLSWLEFNRRVLHEALDERTPLLERVKFLAIFSSNLDEFFMKRMAMIRPSPDDPSLAPQERRERLAADPRDGRLDAGRAGAPATREVLRPQLAEHGIHLLAWDELTEEQRAEASARVRHARSRRC